MARPRQFDEDKVLDAATRVFRERGFDNTSISDLEQATGLVRTSLYGAFGDKEQLFLLVVDRFQHRYDAFAKELLSGQPARAGFEAAFRVWLGINCSSQGPRGCMVQLATSSSADLPRVKELVRDATKSFERTMLQAVTRARTMGELPADADVKLLTRYLLVSIQGLSDAARGGATQKELEPVFALVLDTVFKAPAR